MNVTIPSRSVTPDKSVSRSDRGTTVGRGRATSLGRCWAAAPWAGFTAVHSPAAGVPTRRARGGVPRDLAVDASRLTGDRAHPGQPR